MHFDFEWSGVASEQHLCEISKCDRCGHSAQELVQVELVSKAMALIRAAAGLPWIAQVGTANDEQRRIIYAALHKLSETARRRGDILSVTYSPAAQLSTNRGSATHKLEGS
jgi:hypothetical protein